MQIGFMNEFDITELIDEFQNPFENIYIQDLALLDAPISKYMSFASFIEVLKGNFSVSNRTTFEDKVEHGEYNDRRFYFFHFFPVVKGLKPSEKDLERWSWEDKQRIASKYVYTSSWTYKTYEDYLMWRIYASNGIGIRINTTVKEFLSSLILKNCKLICAKVHYKNAAKQTAFDRLFLKNIEYDSEKEIRFCIVPNIIDIQKKRISVNVSPDFIKSVTLSPFESSNIIDMCRDTIGKLRQDIAIDESKILINNKF